MYMAALGSSIVPAFGQTVGFITLPKTKNLNLGRPLLSRSYKEYGFRPKVRTAATLSSKATDEPKLEKVRPLAHFDPDTWGDYFSDYTPENEEIRKKNEQEQRLLKEEFDKELMKKTREEPLKFLELVDVIERLGVAYHFENIIDEGLKQIYEKDKECIQLESGTLDLYHTSLMFRILRQHRYNIRSNVFERFLDDEGNFLESLKEDPVAVLCLYEAAYVKARGEDILEKAVEFTKSQLNVILDSQPKHPLAPQIKRALVYPNQRGIIRLESRHYISFYEENPCHSKSLLRFAKLDFNLLQSLHKEELKEITRWKQRFNFKEKFPFSRNRTVEAYFFGLATFYEPKFSMARKIFLKGFIALVILDDIYDAFGTIDELEVFTTFLERWDRGCSFQLPDYMKEYFEILYDVFKELEDDLAKLGRINYVDYLRREAIHVSKAYLQEAYWREAKYAPPYEEYFENSIKSCAMGLTENLSLIENDVEENIAIKTFDIVYNNEYPQRAASIIGRCVNDIVDYEFDKQRDHVVGAVECYMKEYGVSKDEACVAINGVIEDAWKDLDEEIFQPKTLIPTPLLMRIHNFTRLVSYMYKYVDGFTVLDQRMKTTLTLLFVEPLC